MTVASEIPLQASQYARHGARTEQSFIARIGKCPEKPKTFRNQVVIVEAYIWEQGAAELGAIFASRPRGCIVLD
jgi:hypothetical protein